MLEREEVGQETFTELVRKNYLCLDAALLKTRESHCDFRFVYRVCVRARVS